MKKCILLTIAVFFSFARLFAQYNAPQNNVWVFGYSVLLDFSSGSPVAGASSSFAFEGGASVSNSAGNLLFYTDGSRVYNRLHVAMPSGSAIVPFATGSTTQSALIVPFINDTNKYYIFSLENQLSTPNMYCHLAYTEVDMTLDGGLGDVIPATAGIVLDSEMSEKLIAIPGKDCNTWVIVHKKDTTLFYVYEVTASGVSAPAIYNVGAFNGIPGFNQHPGYGAYSNGVMKCSHDCSKIFVACIPVASSAAAGGELCDFDQATGVVSNCRIIHPTENMYGAEFSPDDTKLYVNVLAGAHIAQYDLSLPTLAAIQASRTVVSGTNLITGDLKLAPNGKIYACNASSTYLECINNPNLPGLACDYTHNALNIYPTSVTMGLPNLVWASPALTTISGPAAICAGNGASYTASLSGGTWASSNTAVLAIDTVTGSAASSVPGTATITYYMGSTCFVTKQVSVLAAPVDISGSSLVCLGNNTILSNSPAGGHWTSSDTTIATIGYFSGEVTGIAVGTATMTYAEVTGVCHSEKNIEVYVCGVGVANADKASGIQLFPMPMGKELTIKSATPFVNGAKYMLYDVAGRPIMTGSLAGNNNTISVAPIAAGTYQCIVSGAGGEILLRQLVVKQ